MQDLLFLLVVVAFFAVGTLLVRACEWLIEVEQPPGPELDE
jgi:hypothetical protein